MADFYISAIRMDSSGKHIEWVKTHKKTSSNSLESRGTINSRRFVGELISTNKIEFRTVIWDTVNKEWHIGAKVEFMTDGYITTDPNKTKGDNLGNLPKF